MDVWSALLSISLLLVAAALAYALMVSRHFRSAFARAMPTRTKEVLLSLSACLWLVVVLLCVGSAARAVAALLGSSSIFSAGLTGVSAGLALLVAVNVVRACRRLDRSL
jgi:hypothetical protein